jgi:hypothetical protein
VEADKEERWREVLTALLSNKWLLLLHIFLSLFVVAVEKPLAYLIIEPSLTLTLFTLICSADPFPKSLSLSFPPLHSQIIDSVWSVGFVLGPTFYNGPVFLFFSFSFRVFVKELRKLRERYDFYNILF